MIWWLRKRLIRILAGKRAVAINLEYGGWIAPARTCLNFGMYENVTQEKLSAQRARTPGLPPDWLETMRPPGT